MGKGIISDIIFAIIFSTKLPEGCIVILSTFVILLMASLDIVDILCDSKGAQIEADIFNDTQMIPIEILYVILGLFLIIIIIALIKFMIDMKKELSNKHFILFFAIVLFHIGLIIYAGQGMMLFDDIISICIREIIAAIVASKLQVLKNK